MLAKKVFGDLCRRLETSYPFKVHSVKPCCHMTFTHVFKPSCQIPFQFAFAVLHLVLEEVILVGQNKRFHNAIQCVKPMHKLKVATKL